MKKHRIKFNKTESLYFLLLFPFFEPGCIGNFTAYEINESLFGLIGKLYAVGRYLVSLIVFLLFIREIYIEKKKPTPLFIPLLVNFVFNLISNIVGKTKANSVLSVIYEIGFICLIELLINKGIRKFIRVSLVIFTTLSFLGAWSILAFPNGFNHAKDVAYAIYFLGSKNASVNIYLIFILAFCGYEYEKTGKLTVKSIIFLALFLATGIITQSGSTIVCLVMLLGYYVLQYVSHAKFTIRPWVPFVTAIASIIFIYIGVNYKYIIWIVSSLGKDITFSGRTILWLQATEHFVKSPFLGVGIEAEFHNFSGFIQYSAHSQYLDRLAKYGIFAFSCFIYVIIYTERRLCKAKDRGIASLFGVIFTVYLLRMGFDTYDFKYFIIICYLAIEILAVIDGKINNQKLRKV